MLRRSFTHVAGALTVAVAITLLAGATGSAVKARPEQDREARALDFQHLGTYGGSYTAVVVTGTRALATRGRVLEVLDVADPAAPRLLAASAQLPAGARVAAAGPGVAYLVERDSSAPDIDDRFDQLHVVTVRDSGAPALAGSLRLPHHALEDVLAVGRLLFGAGSKEGVVRIDASDPSKPNLEQVLDLGAGVSGLAAWDGRLLAAATDSDHGGWLVVLEPLGALHPNEIARIRTGGTTGKIAVTGHYAFVESRQSRPDGAYEGATVVVDLAEADSPRIVGRLPMSGVRDFAITPDRVFALAAPSPLSSYDVWSVETAGLPDMVTVRTVSQWGWAMAAAGDRALLAAGPAGLITLGRVVGTDGGATIEAEHALPVLGAPQGVAIANGHAYLCDADAEIWVLDVRDPSAVVAVGRTHLEHRNAYALTDGRGGTLAVRDGLAYVARQSARFQPGGLHVFDVTDPALPRQIGLWDPYVQAEIDPTYLEWGSITGLRPPEIVGHRVWLSGYPALTEVDVADPARPRLVRHGDLPPDNSGYMGLDAGGTATDGSRLYAAAYVSGVYATDVSASGPITFSQRAEMPGIAADVALVGRHLLAVGYAGTGLRVLDADTLGAVRAVEGLEAGGVEVAGDTAYVLATDGVYAFDVGDPSTPMLRGLYAAALDSDTTQIAIDGDVMALTRGDAGLDLLRLVDGQALPEPTPGPTLTPWPTRPPGTQPRITPLPTRTFDPTMTPDRPATTVRPTSRLYLPSVLSPLDDRSAACSSAGGIGASEAEEYARNRARLEACEEPDMRRLECITVREADELYDAELQGFGPGGVPLDPDLCIWWAVFDGRARPRTRPQPNPTAIPTSVGPPVGTPPPTEDPCPAAVLMVGFEKPGDWLVVHIVSHTEGTEPPTPEGTVTPLPGLPTLTPRSWPTPTVLLVPTVTPTPLF